MKSNNQKQRTLAKTCSRCGKPLRVKSRKEVGSSSVQRHTPNGIEVVIELHHVKCPEPAENQ